MNHNIKRVTRPSGAVAAHNDGEAKVAPDESRPAEGLLKITRQKQTDKRAHTSANTEETKINQKNDESSLSGPAWSGSARSQL